MKVPLQVFRSILPLLIVGCDLEGPGPHLEAGAGPLHRAAAEGNVDDVLRLIDSGVPVDVRAGTGDGQAGYGSEATPLHFAARDGRYVIAKMLVRRGADVNARTMGGRTPLHLAARSRLLECANPLRDGDAQGLTEGHRSVVELLLDEGAAADPRDFEGSTPLLNAAQCNDVEIATLLMARGADINHRGHQYSVLDMAVAWGPEVAKLLIENGAEVNTVTPFSGQVPLHTAAERGRGEVARLLIEHGADVNARGGSGETALHAAARRCERQLIETLLEHGADRNAVNDGGEVPETVARCGEDVARLLRRHDR